MGHFGEAFDIILRRMALRQDEADEKAKSTSPTEIPIEEIVESIVDQLRHKEPTLREKLLSHYMKGYRMGTLEDLSTYILQKGIEIPGFTQDYYGFYPYTRASFFVNNAVLRTNEEIFLIKGSPILCFPEIAAHEKEWHTFALGKGEYEYLISRKGESFRIDQTKISDLAKRVKELDDNISKLDFYDIVRFDEMNNSEYMRFLFGENVSEFAKEMIEKDKSEGKKSVKGVSFHIDIPQPKKNIAYVKQIHMSIENKHERDDAVDNDSKNINTYSPPFPYSLRTEKFYNHNKIFWIKENPWHPGTIVSMIE